MSPQLIRPLLAACLTVLALATLSTQATASRAIATPGLLVNFTGAVAITVPGAATVACVLRLGTSLRPSILKTPGAVISTAGAPLSTLANCTGGVTGTIDTAIDVGFTSFTGTLPAITSVAGTFAPIQFTLKNGVFGAAGCVFSSAAGALSVTYLGTAGTFRSANFAGALTSTGRPCPATGTILGGSLTANLDVQLGLLN